MGTTLKKNWTQSRCKLIELKAHTSADRLVCLLLNKNIYLNSGLIYKKNL